MLNTCTVHVLTRVQPRITASSEHTLNTAVFMNTRYKTYGKFDPAQRPSRASVQASRPPPTDRRTDASTFASTCGTGRECHHVVRQPRAARAAEAAQFARTEG